MNSKLEKYAEDFYIFSGFEKLSLENTSLSYSAMVRLLNEEYKPSTVNNFQKSFKENFDRLYLEGNEEPEDEALEIAVKSIGKFHKKANAIEMGDSEFAGKRLADLVRFLLRRIPDDRRSKAIQSVKRKLYMLNEFEISNKNTPVHSSMGQAVTVIKNLLLENNPQYIRNVLNAIVRSL